jgi:hypothetical protein
MKGFHPNTARRIIRNILDRVDIPDPHEFCTAYVNHAESVRAQRGTPMPVSLAVQRWLSLGTV